MGGLPLTGSVPLPEDQLHELAARIAVLRQRDHELGAPLRPAGLPQGLRVPQPADQLELPALGVEVHTPLLMGDRQGDDVMMERPPDLRTIS